MNIGKGFRAFTIGVVSLMMANTGLAQDHRHLDAAFTPAGLPPMRDAFRPVSGDDVKRFWISQMPQVFPPSRSSPG